MSGTLKTLLIYILALLPMGMMAQDKLPVPAKPTSWVNDYAGVFSSDQARQLDQKLNGFEYRNSTQIFVVTVSDNGGYTVGDLAPRIGEAWGIGQKGKDNGMLILMDMKDRDVFISTGYGLEEFIPDAIAKRVVENEILPAFKKGDYYGGIDAGTSVLVSLVEGKFTADQYSKQSSSRSGSSIGSIIFMIILFSIFFGGGRRRSAGMGGRRSNLPLWMALGMMSGGRSSGSFGNFSGGGGGFGGFGGGGGGSFGGGGAGGSW